MSRPESVFVLLAAAFGTAMAIATPPFDAPDEWRHLARAYLLSEGHVQPVGRAAGYSATIPYELVAIHELHGVSPREHRVSDALYRLRFPFDASRRVPLTAKLDLRTAGISSPLAHAPQAFAVAAGRMLGLSAAALLYLARLATLATWLALCSLAIRLSPLRSWTFALLCLTPMSVFLAGSASSDSLASGIALLLVSLVLRAAFGGAAMDRRRAGVILLLCAALGLVKLGYFIIAAAVGVIPAGGFADSRQRWKFFAATGVAALLPAVLWSAWALAADPAPAVSGADPAGQLRHLASPWVGPTVLARTLAVRAPGWFAGWVGRLGYLEVILPMFVYAAVPAMLIAVTLLDRADPDSFRPSQRLYLAAIGGIGALAIFAVSYLAWSPVGSEHVLAIQGRYFAPLVPLVLVAVPSVRAPPRWFSAPLFGGFAAAVLAVSVATLVRHYYGSP